MSKHILLTGATGLLGRCLLRDLLLAGVPVAVLIRARGDESASSRLGDILDEWEGDLPRPLSRPVVLQGDMTEPGLGLGKQQRRWLAQHCGSVLHNAASLTFVGTDRSRDPWLSNLTGTANVLEACREAGLREFHYISTAFVCGQRPSPILETDLPPTRGFRNDYEQSKAEAERLVRSASFLDDLTVYRPAIIVGDSVTGHTTSYHGLYAYLQLAWVVSSYAEVDEGGRRYIPVRFDLTGEEGRNLVPVDWVSAAITHILLVPKYHRQTYHLTPPRRTTARQIDAAVASRFNYFGTSFVGPDGLTGELNDVEKLFYGSIALYAAYWAGEPEFDCANTRSALPHLPCPPIDTPMLHRLIDFAVEDRWGKRRVRRAAKT
jgi:thioester reductase-like protein